MVPCALQRMVVGPVVWVLLLLTMLDSSVGHSLDDEVNAEAVYADDCEICLLTAAEVENAFERSAKTRDVLVTAKGARHSYLTSEVRFVETMDNVCEGILDYRMHKEHKDIRRFRKGRSRTIKTLQGLVEKGVKVDLGLPEHLWDEPSVEVTELKLQCDKIVERFEEDLEAWYHDGRKIPLTRYLCHDRFLKQLSSDCLQQEKFVDATPVIEEKPKTEKTDVPEVKKKGDMGSKAATAADSKQADRKKMDMNEQTKHKIKQTSHSDNKKKQPAPSRESSQNKKKGTLKYEDVPGGIPLPDLNGAGTWKRVTI